MSNFRDDHNSYLETPLASVADESRAELAKLLDEPEITLMMRADGVCPETLLQALQDIAAALHIHHETEIRPHSNATPPTNLSTASRSGRACRRAIAASSRPPR